MGYGSWGTSMSVNGAAVAFSTEPTRVISFSVTGQNQESASSHVLEMIRAHAEIKKRLNEQAIIDIQSKMAHK